MSETFRLCSDFQASLGISVTLNDSPILMCIWSLISYDVIFGKLSLVSLWVLAVMFFRVSDKKWPSILWLQCKELTWEELGKESAKLLEETTELQIK